MKDVFLDQIGTLDKLISYMRDEKFFEEFTDRLFINLKKSSVILDTVHKSHDLIVKNNLKNDQTLRSILNQCQILEAREIKNLIKIKGDIGTFKNLNQEYINDLLSQAD